MRRGQVDVGGFGWWTIALLILSVVILISLIYYASVVHDQMAQMQIPGLT